LKVICKLQCEDCGPSIVLKKDFISVAKLGDSYQYATRCRYCHRDKIGDIDEDMVLYLISKDVFVHDWLSDFEENGGVIGGDAK